MDGRGVIAGGGWGVLPQGSQAALSASAPLSAALKSSPSKKGRGALLAVKPLGPTAAFSASQIPSEREDAQYDLRGARSYPTLEDEGDRPGWGTGASLTGEIRALLGEGSGCRRQPSVRKGSLKLALGWQGPG